MPSALLVSSICLARVLTCCSLLAGVPLGSLEYNLQSAQDLKGTTTLVRVNIITEIRGAKDTIELNGRLLADYSPVIVQNFLSTGIVLDHRSHIMTFLGYRWVDIQSRDPRIVISTNEGRKWRGKLVGIDQSNGVAVIRLLKGKLKKTPVCAQCEVKNGATVMSPVIDDPGLSQYRETQIVSVGTGPGFLEPGEWLMSMNRPFPDIGQPILTSDHRVLGFIAGRDPIEMRTVVYPIAQLISSAEKILKMGGDIRAGWLGIFIQDSRPAGKSGVMIQRVVPDSPAQRAGLAAQDYLMKYNGQEIHNARQFIQLVEGTSIGSMAQLEINRQGNPMAVIAQIGTRKPQPYPDRLSFNLPGSLDPADLESRHPRLLIGLHTIALTASLAEYLRMPGQTGLLVSDVDKESPADRAGILVGDVILSVDGQPTNDPLGFVSFLQTHSWGAQSVLRILRKGTETTIVVQISE